MALFQLEWDQMLWDVVLILLEGTILALVINKWNEVREERKESRKVKALMTTFYKMLKEQKPVDLYYFLKVNPREDLARIQLVLLMDLFTEPQADSLGTRDVLSLQNNQFRLRLDPKFETHINTKVNVFFNFSKPQENAEIYTSFVEYVKKQGKDKGIQL